MLKSLVIADHPKFRDGLGSGPTKFAKHNF